MTYLKMTTSNQKNFDLQKRFTWSLQTHQTCSLDDILLSTLEIRFVSDMGLAQMLKNFDQLF